MSASKKIITWFGLWMAILVPAVAQQSSKMPYGPNPAFSKVLDEVSADRLRAYDEKLVSFGTRHTLSANDPAVQGEGIQAAAKWIESQFQEYSRDCGGCLEVKSQTETQGVSDRIPTPTPITNVYAILRGTDPASAGRIVIMSGHYDSRASEANDFKGPAPGANDDGSGTIAVLEAARVLSKYKFAATIVFATFAAEEQGLFGARHFAEMAKRQNWQIEAVLNNDIIGGDKSPGQDPTKVRVFSEGLPAAATPQEIRAIRGLGGENDSPSREVARYVEEIGSRYFRGKNFSPVMIFRPDRYLRGGDQTPFNQLGIAAVRLTEWRENYNHQHQNPRTENGIEYGDLPKFVDFNYVARVTALNAVTLASLASAPAPPAHVRLLTRDLENDSRLQWEPSSGGRVDYYEVVWRSTDAPDWTDSRNVGQATSATIPLSKDNVIFGVRAVNSQGDRSLVVVPSPER